MPKRFFLSRKTEYRDRKAVRSAMAALAGELREKKLEVEKVILFGSYATGKAGYFSDADLLIVVKEDPRPVHERSPEYLLLLKDAPVPVDVFIVTKAELVRRLKENDPFLTRVLGEGVLLA